MKFNEKVYIFEFNKHESTKNVKYLESNNIKTWCGLSKKNELFELFVRLILNNKYTEIDKLMYKTNVFDIYLIHKKLYDLLLRMINNNNSRIPLLPHGGGTNMFIPVNQNLFNLIKLVFKNLESYLNKNCYVNNLDNSSIKL